MKEKILMLLCGSWIFATLSIFMFIPSSWWAGYAIGDLICVWLLWTVLPVIFIACIRFCVCLVLALIKFHREKKCYHAEEIELRDRKFCYVGRDVICKASGSSFVRR